MNETPLHAHEANLIPSSEPPLFDGHSMKVACSNCNLRELCLPMGLNSAEMSKLDDVISTRRRIKRGAALFSTGERFTSLYAVRSGFFKTCVTTADGRDQVTGFQMAGEIIGLCDRTQ